MKTNSEPTRGQVGVRLSHESSSGNRPGFRPRQLHEILFQLVGVSHVLDPGADHSRDQGGVRSCPHLGRCVFPFFIVLFSDWGTEHSRKDQA